MRSAYKSFIEARDVALDPFSALERKGRICLLPDANRNATIIVHTGACRFSGLHDFQGPPTTTDGNYQAVFQMLPPSLTGASNMIGVGTAMNKNNALDDDYFQWSATTDATSPFGVTTAGTPKDGYWHKSTSATLDSTMKYRIISAGIRVTPYQAKGQGLYEGFIMDKSFWFYEGGAAMDYIDGFYRTNCDKVNELSFTGAPFEVRRGYIPGDYRSLYNSGCPALDTEAARIDIQKMPGIKFSSCFYMRMRFLIECVFIAEYIGVPQAAQIAWTPRSRYSVPSLNWMDYITKP